MSGYDLRSNVLSAVLADGHPPRAALTVEAEQAAMNQMLALCLGLCSSPINPRTDMDHKDHRTQRSEDTRGDACAHAATEDTVFLKFQSGKIRGITCRPYRR